MVVALVALALLGNALLPQGVDAQCCACPTGVTGTGTNLWTGTGTGNPGGPTTPRPPDQPGYGGIGCDCVVEHIWEDIVVVVDTSSSMGKSIAEVQANIATIFGQMTINQNINQSSRVGFVSVDRTATIVADLFYYNSSSTLVTDVFSVIKATNNTDLDLEAGLQRAGDVLRTTRVRNNTQQVVIVYTTAYSTGGFNDPLPAAKSLNESGIYIITIAFVQADQGPEAQRIGQLATPGYNFSSLDLALVNETLTALCDINCFCKANWVQQYTGGVLFSPYLIGINKKMGACHRYTDIDAGWTSAKQACHYMASEWPPFLASSIDAPTQKFILDYVGSNDTTNPPVRPTEFHIGLKFDSSRGRYYWDQDPNLYLQDWTFSSWLSGYPNNANGFDCVEIGTGPGGQKGWRNINCFTNATRYMCEMHACDTEHYCGNIFA